MKIKNIWPPHAVLALLEAHDPAFKTRTDILINYDGVIYNPHHIEVTEEFLAHEQVHEEQQKAYKEGPLAYVERYLSDSVFRVHQEVAAYVVQAEYLIAQGQARTKAYKSMAGRLSNAVYKVGITEAGALMMLNDYRNRHL